MVNRHRVGVFYLSQKDSTGAQPFKLNRGGVVYIRMDEHQITEPNALLIALDTATPREGEMVMNSHPLPVIAKAATS